MNSEIAPKFITEQERTEKAIVTGGTEGIGRAIVSELVGQNHDVVICARTKEKLEEIRAENKIEAVQLDLGDTEKIKDFVKQGLEKIGGVTVLILNAAVPGIRESDDYTLRVNRDAQKVLVESAANLLRASKGRIVFLSSSQAKNPVEDNRIYGQSKKEVEDWLQEFSSKEENKNIHIFSVNPGPTDTRMQEEAISYGGEIIRNRSIKTKDEGKLRDPQIIGRIISKMSVTGRKFNPETNQYDIAIGNNEIVTISEENIEFEKNVVVKGYDYFAAKEKL